jgi:hypothetical protein
MVAAINRTFFISSSSKTERGIEREGTRRRSALLAKKCRRFLSLRVDQNAECGFALVFPCMVNETRLASNCPQFHASCLIEGRA